MEMRRTMRTAVVLSSSGVSYRRALVATRFPLSTMTIDIERWRAVPRCVRLAPRRRQIGWVTHDRVRGLPTEPRA